MSELTQQANHITKGKLYKTCENAMATTQRLGAVLLIGFVLSGVE